MSNLMNNQGMEKVSKQQEAGRLGASKKLLVDDYKRRLKDNIKSLNENFCRILAVAKVSTDEAVHRNNSNVRMAELYSIRNEICARATLMIKAGDELVALNNDVREFLILRDFNFLTNSIQNTETEQRKIIEEQEALHDKIRHELNSINLDIERELSENFGRK